MTLQHSETLVGQSADYCAKFCDDRARYRAQNSTCTDTREQSVPIMHKRVESEQVLQTYLGKNRARLNARQAVRGWELYCWNCTADTRLRLLSEPSTMSTEKCATQWQTQSEHERNLSSRQRTDKHRIHRKRKINAKINNNTSKCAVFSLCSRRRPPTTRSGGLENENANMNQWKCNFMQLAQHKRTGKPAHLESAV